MLGLMLKRAGPENPALVVGIVQVVVGQYRNISMADS